MSVDKVQEMDVNAAVHPYHMHINHMQLTTVGGGGWGGWHQEGDFVDTYLGTGTVRFITADFKGEAMMHCHLLLHEDMGCMAQMYIVDDKTSQPWGYCLHGTAIPGVAAILMSCLSALFACLLALTYSGQIQRVKQALLPGPCCLPASEDVVYCCLRPLYGTIATILVVPLFVVSVLPLVNDDGYSSSSVVALLHANQNSYDTFLPLHIVMMVITLAAAACLVYLRWIRAGNDGGKYDVAVAPADGGIALTALPTADGTLGSSADAAGLGVEKGSDDGSKESSLVPKGDDAEGGYQCHGTNKTVNQLSKEEEPYN